jgi:hypothetical protein
MTERVIENEIKKSRVNMIELTGQIHLHRRNEFGLTPLAVEVHSTPAVHRIEGNPTPRDFEL